MIQVIGDNDLATLPTTGAVGKVLRRLKIFKRTCVTAAAPLPSRPSAKPGIGGGPKKRGRQGQWVIAAPPPPTQRIGGEGRISREKRHCLPISGLIWRKGSNFPRKCRVFACFAEGVLPPCPPLG